MSAIWPVPTGVGDTATTRSPGPSRPRSREHHGQPVRVDLVGGAPDLCRSATRRLRPDRRRSSVSGHVASYPGAAATVTRGRRRPRPAAAGGAAPGARRGSGGDRCGRWSTNSSTMTVAGRRPRHADGRHLEDPVGRVDLDARPGRAAPGCRRSATPRCARRPRGRGGGRPTRGVAVGPDAAPPSRAPRRAGRSRGARGRAAARAAAARVWRTGRRADHR